MKEGGVLGKEQVVSVTALYVMIGSLDFNLEDLIHSFREKVISVEHKELSSFFP